MREGWQGDIAIFLIRLAIENRCMVSLVAYGAAPLISFQIKAPLLDCPFFRSPHVPDSPEVYLIQRDEVRDGPSKNRSASVADGSAPGAASAAVRGEGGGRKKD